jgi:malate synthase
MTTTTALANAVETEILTPDASIFLTRLGGRFESRRQELLIQRRVRQHRIDAGELPDFLPETAAIREKEWAVAPIPHDLADRRVEITGPVDRKMIINALNSGANVFMADFEDSNSPTWQNNLEGQLNLRDAVEGTISFVSPEGKRYELNPHMATLASGGDTLPRGWQANFRFSLRLRTLLFSQREGTQPKRDRAVFLSAQIGKPSRSAFVERRLLFRAR